MCLDECGNSFTDCRATIQRTGAIKSIENIDGEGFN